MNSIRFLVVGLVLAAVVLTASPVVASAHDDTVAVRHVFVKGSARDAYMRIIGILARHDFAIVAAWPEILAVTAEKVDGFNVSHFHNAVTVTVAGDTAYITLRRYGRLSGGQDRYDEFEPGIFEPVLAEIEGKPSDPLGAGQ